MVEEEPVKKESEQASVTEGDKKKKEKLEAEKGKDKEKDQTDTQKGTVIPLRKHSSILFAVGLSYTVPEQSNIGQIKCTVLFL